MTLDEFTRSFCTPECIEQCRDALTGVDRQWHEWHEGMPSASTIRFHMLTEEITVGDDAETKRRVWGEYVRDRMYGGDRYALDLEVLYQCDDLQRVFPFSDPVDSVGAMNDLWELQHNAGAAAKAHACVTLASLIDNVPPEYRDLLECPGVVVLLCKGSDLHDPQASFELGRLFASGRHLGPNERQAHRYFVRAAHEGFAHAWVYVAMDCANGFGTKASPDAMIDAFMEGAVHGDYTCCMMLGHLFSRGCPGSKLAARPDMQMANEYYAEALSLESMKVGSYGGHPEREDHIDADGNVLRPLEDDEMTEAYVDAAFTEIVMREFQGE